MLNVVICLQNVSLIDYNILDFNEKNDKISQINSLLKGIEVKLRKIGYVYEYIKEIVAKNEFNEKILLKNRCEIILEKKYELTLNQEDFIEIFNILDLNELMKILISIRHIKYINS